MSVHVNVPRVFVWNKVISTLIMFLKAAQTSLKTEGIIVVQQGDLVVWTQLKLETCFAACV